MLGRAFATILLLAVGLCGFALVVGGGVIFHRGLVLYEWDPVLLGTGGGLAAGGLGVLALCVMARAQMATARDTARLVALMEAPAAARSATDAADDAPPRDGPRLLGERRAR
jgi:hypothetical protein